MFVLWLMAEDRTAAGEAPAVVQPAEGVVSVVMV